jgi:hypothetical protein
VSVSGPGRLNQVAEVLGREAVAFRVRDQPTLAIDDDGAAPND